MAITPPGAGELARLRDLVGGSTPLAPASTGPSTPLADPTGGVQPTPLAPAAGPPMFKSSLLQQIPEEPPRPEEIGLEPEMEEVIDPEEQERRKWAFLETPPELIPVVMRKAAEAGITAEDLIKEGRPWSDAFPEDQIENVEKEAGAIQAIKRGAYAATEEDPYERGAVEDLSPVEVVDPDLSQAKVGADAQRVAEARRVEDELRALNFPAGPQFRGPEAVGFDDPQEQRKREYYRQVLRHKSKQRPTAPPNIRPDAIEDPDERNYYIAWWADQRRLGLTLPLRPPSMKHEIARVDLGPQFDPKHLAKKQARVEREVAVRRGDPEVAGQLTSVVADRAVFESLDKPRVALPPGATYSEVRKAVTDAHSADSQELWDAYSERKATLTKEYEERVAAIPDYAGVSAKLSIEREAKEELEAKLKEESQKTRDSLPDLDAELDRTVGWHKHRDRLPLAERKVEGLPEPTDIQKDTTEALLRDLPVLPEKLQAEYNQMVLDLEKVPEGDTDEMRRIVAEYGKLPGGAPLNVSEEGVVNLAMAEVPHLKEWFRATRNSSSREDNMIGWRLFGYAPLEAVQAYIGRSPDGNAKIDFKVDPSVAEQYMAPVGEETEEQTLDRVNKILKAFTRKTFLEKHPDYLVSSQYIISALAAGRTKKPSVISELAAVAPKAPEKLDLRRADKRGLGQLSLMDEEADVRKVVDVSEIDVDDVRLALVKGEDPELLRTAHTIGFTEEAILRAAVKAMTGEEALGLPVRELSERAGLDRRVVEAVFASVGNVEDLRAILSGDDSELRRLVENDYRVGVTRGVSKKEDQDRYLKELRSHIQGILQDTRVREAAAAAEALGKLTYAQRDVGDEPVPDFTTVFENQEDALFRGRALWKPEHVIYDPTGVDDPSFLDHYETFTDNDGLVMVGEEARNSVWFNSQVEVDLAMDRNKALLDMQAAPKPVVVEILAGEMLGHERYFPERLAQHDVTKSVMFKVPYVMDFEVGLPMAQAVYDISNEMLGNPRTEQDRLKVQLVETLQYAYGRSQPVSFKSKSLHAYKDWVEKREKRSITIQQAMMRWEANRVKWEAKYKQIIMEGFLPQEHRTGFRAKIHTVQARQIANFSNFLRFTELVPIDMWMMADPNERWRNFKNQRRLPVGREALEFLKPATKGYMEGQRHQHITGYNAFETLNRAFDPGMGTSLVTNMPVPEDMARAGSTAITPTPGLIDLTVAQQYTEHASRIGATIQAVAHDEHPHHRAQNFQAIVNSATRFAEADIIYDDFIELIENQDQRGVLDILKIHLPHSVNNFIRGTWGLIKEGVDVGVEVFTTPLLYAAGSVLDGTMDTLYKDQFIEKVAGPDGRAIYRVKKDEQGNPLIDVKTAQRLMMTDSTLGASLKDLSLEHIEEAHRKLFITTPAALKEVAHFYIETFSDWDKFKGYVKADPFGAFLDIAGGYSLLGKVKVPGAARMQRVRRIDQAQASARQKIRTRRADQRPQDVLSPEEVELFDPRVLEEIDRRVTFDGPPAATKTELQKRIKGMPRQYDRAGDPILPYGYTESQIATLAGPAEWVSLRSIPHRFVAFIEHARNEGARVRRAAGLTEADLSIRYDSSLAIIADSLKFLDHNVPILGPVVGRGAQIAVDHAASGSRFGMVASYFMNKDTYAGTDLRVKLTEGDQDVHLTTIKTHTNMVKAMDAIGRRLIDGDRLPNIRTILKHTTEEAAEEAFGAKGTSLIKLKSSKKKLRVRRVDVEKYIAENYDEFSNVLDDLWQGEVVDPDRFTVDVGDGNYINLEDLGLVDRKGRPSKKLKALKEDQSKAGRAVLNLVQQEISRSDTRLSDSPAARRTRLYGITKKIDGKRVTVNVLEEDFIQMMESTGVVDWAFEVMNEVSTKGHLDDMMDGGANPFMMYFRTAEVEVAWEGGGVARVGGPGGKIRRVAVEDGEVIDDAAIAVKNAYAGVVFEEIKDKRKLPVNIVERNGRPTIVVDEMRVLSEWTPGNEKFVNGNKFHGPIGEVRFATPGEYLDFVIEAARAKVAIKKGPKQSVASHRADYTEEALNRFRDKRRGVPSPGRVTDKHGGTLRYETITGETKTAVRGGQVVGFDLHDLGFVRRNGKHWVLSDAGNYVFQTSIDALRVRGPGPVTTGGLADLTHKIFQLVSDGKRGLFAVSNKEMDKGLKFLESEIAAGKVGTKGDIRGPYEAGRADGLAFIDVARSAGLKPTIAVTSNKLLEAIKSLFDEELVVKTTGDFVAKGIKSVKRKDRDIHAIYRADGTPLTDADLNAALRKFDAGDDAATLAALKEKGLTPALMTVAKKKDVMLYAYDFTDSAIGRLVKNAGDSGEHLRRVVKALSDELGQSRDQAAMAGKPTKKYERTTGRKFTPEMEATLRITEEANLERMRNNPIGAVQGAMMALTHEQRLAFLSWLKNGVLPEIVKTRPDILKAWEKVGLVDMFGATPRMSPLGVLSSVFVVDHAKSFYRTMFTRALMKDAQLFSGPQGSLFFNPRNYLPPKLGYLAEILQGTLTDVQAGLALDWAEHINLMGLEHSTAGTRNMLTHWTRVYQGTFDKYLRGGNVMDYLDKNISKQSVIRDRSYKELMDQQARKKGVVADLAPHEAALFARVEMRHNMHRARVFKQLVAEGRIRAGAVKASGDYIAPGPSAEWVHLNLEDMRVMKTPTRMGTIPDEVGLSDVPMVAMEKVVLPAVELPGKIAGAVSGDAKATKAVSRMRARFKAVEEHQAKFAEKADNLHYIFGDLANSADKMFIRRNDAAIMGLEDRFQHAWARQVLKEAAELNVPGLTWDKVAAGAVLGLEAVYEVANAVHNHPLTKVFKVRKLMMSALGPASRNVQANTMLTFSLHPRAILSNEWWGGLNEYWTYYRNGKRPPGAAGAFMDEVSSLGLVQSGLLKEAGFQDYTRLNVGVDKWLSDIKKRMDDYVSVLEEGEKAVNAAMYASQDLAISIRSMYSTGSLDGGDLMKAVTAGAADNKLASASKQGIVRKMINTDVKQVAKDVQEALAPVPFQSISAENRFLRAGKNVFNHTDEAFKYAYLKYLYDVKGLRGLKLKDTLFKHWPDYGQVADWERMYSLKNSFGVYETKMYQIMINFMLEHPERARALGLANEMIMATMLSDPETFEAWKELPGYRRMSTSRYPFGFLDEGGFNVMSADRFEVNAFNNPVFQLFLALTGHGSLWGQKGQPNNAAARGWFANLLSTTTEIAYGSVQVNPAEFAMNLYDSKTDYGRLNEITTRYGRDAMDWGRSFKSAAMQSGGPRWNAIMAAFFDEPYPTGADKPPQSVLSALGGAMFGTRVIEQDPFLQESTRRRTIGESIGLVRDLQSQVNRMEKAAMRLGRNPIPSIQQRYARAALIERIEDVIATMNAEAERQGASPQMWRVLKLAKQLRIRALKGGAQPAPQFRGEEGRINLRQEEDLLKYKRLRESNDEIQRLQHMFK